MDRMREEFETWVKSYAEKIKYKYMDRVLLRDSADGYLSTWVDSTWIGWKASRAALCVQMPKITDFARDSSGERELLNFEFAVECIARELNDAGVRYE